METIQDVALWRIVRSRFQPRAPLFDEEPLVELVNSLFEHGLLNPIHVFACDSVGYELIAGERRTRAAMALALAEIFPNHDRADWARRLALTGIPAHGSPEYQALYARCDTIRALVHTGEDMEHMHNLAVIENLDRSDLTPLEEARAYQSLIDAYGYRQRELAGRVGRSQGYVAQRIALLGLGEAAQEAVNMRVIGMTEARALAAVTPALQDAATKWVTEAIKRDNSPTTTRQVEAVLREVTAFTEASRWDPNPAHGYTPEQRNKLRLVQWALKNTDIGQAGDRLLALRASSVGENLLHTAPVEMVRRDYRVNEVLIALLPRLRHAPLPYQAAWHEYADGAANAHCEQCAFSGPEVATGSVGATHCPRWNNAERGLADRREFTTCINFIGAGDPVIIPVENIRLQHLLREAGLPLAAGDEGRLYATDVAAYTEAVRQAVTLKRQSDQAMAAAVRAVYVQEIQQFYDWQATLSEWERGHIQAHTCAKCRHYVAADTPPCVCASRSPFMRHDGARAPYFGMLVNQAGQRLPRCEGFSYQRLPFLPQPTRMTLTTEPERLRGWLAFITHSVQENYPGWLWRGPLAWAEPSSVEMGRYNATALVNWIVRQSQEWGDAVLVGVIEFIMDDVTGLHHRGNTVTLRNGMGHSEAFAVLTWDGFQTGRQQFGWPEGFPKVWEANRE